VSGYLVDWSSSVFKQAFGEYGSGVLYSEWKEEWLAVGQPGSEGKEERVDFSVFLHH
jgi:hypothetical protein